MGKKKGKKVDVEKKAALQAKKEAKQEKAARKRLSKQQKGSSGVSDGGDDGSNNAVNDAIDEVLLAYKSSNDINNNQNDQNGKKTKSLVEKPTLEPLDNGSFPLPRANATLEYCSDDGKKKGGEFLWYFGGEYFDGVENIVLDELLRYDTTKREWKRLVLPPTSPKPAPRCAHSCVSYKNNLYVWGGELATADQYHHYRDLWVFDTSKLEWREISARNPPSARSGHACFVWKQYMIVFGGFFEALRETKWYNDVHIFNLQTEQWMDGIQPSRLAAKPEPRSGMNAALYGMDKAIVHGGFSKLKAASANKSNTKSSTSSSQTPASASETKVHSDAWVLHLAPILQQKPPTWERWISSTKTSNTQNTTRSSTPNGRAGTSSVSYKDRMITFGGVVDNEQLHHKVDSIFFGDLMMLDIDRRKWFPLHVRNNRPTSGGRRRKKGKDNTVQGAGEMLETDQTKEQDESDNESTGSDFVAEAEAEDNDDNAETGWDLDMLRSNMFAFVDGQGNIIYEKITDDEEKKVDDSDEEEEKEEEKEDNDEGDEEKEESKEEEEEEDEAVDDTTSNGDNSGVANKEPATSSTTKNQSSQLQTGPSKKITASSVMTVDETTSTPKAVERTEPLPRINAAVIVLKQNIYVLGGILEVGDREVTLDDMWCLDLRKREQWECLWSGTMYKQVWRGAVHDDDDSYISTSKEDGSDDENDDDDELSDVEENAITGSDRKSTGKRSGLRQEISELNERYNLEDSNRTPKTDESLADFYARTSSYWNEQASNTVSEEEAASMTAKERKRAGFGHAKERYEELQPVLERLAELGMNN